MKSCEKHFFGLKSYSSIFMMQVQVVQLIKDVNAGRMEWPFKELISLGAVIALESKKSNLRYFLEFVLPMFYHKKKALLKNILLSLFYPREA